MPGIQPSDFVGYSVGTTTDAPPEVGFVGLLDFTGIPVGLPSAPTEPLVGMTLLDFAGYKTGTTTVTPAAPILRRGGGKPKRKFDDDEDLLLMM